MPNVSFCVDTPNEVHYNPLRCEETIVYEIIGSPSYPSTIDGADTSFDIIVNYQRTDISSSCTETVTEGSDTIRVECGTNPSTASSRTVEGTYDYHGLEIAYSVTQTKFEAKVTAKFNVTDTTSPTRIGYFAYISGFSTTEIDGVKQPNVISAYTFDTTGEHTVKYTLTDPSSIDDWAFSYCNSLESIDIPNSVTSIGAGAFYSCTSLTSITIPDSVISIVGSAFDNTPWWSTYSADTSNYYGNIIYINNIAYKATSTTITSVSFKGSTITIGYSAFEGCTSLTSIDIPSGVIIIEQGAFRGCTNLTSITIPSGVTSIGGITFGSCTSLTSITIPSGVTSIGGITFGSCTSLTSITIPSGVTSIDFSAFSECTSLTSVTIGSSVTGISNNAFYHCSGLTSIICNATTAPTIQSSTFEGVNTNGTLYVPIGSSGYDVWMKTSSYYLGKYNWTKVEQ